MSDTEIPVAETQERDVSGEAIEAIPVRIPHSVDTQPQGADFGSWAAYHLAGTEQPQVILPSDPSRHRATIGVSVVAAATTDTSGTVTTPAAGAVITSQVLGEGTYMVNWTVQLSGTLASPADLNNFGLYLGATLLATANVPAAAGSYPQLPQTVVVPAGGGTVAIKAIGLATTGAIYTAVLVTAVGTPGAELVYVGTTAQCLTKTGGVILAGQQYIVENNQALSMAPDGINPVIVVVLTERWGSGT